MKAGAVVPIMILLTTFAGASGCTSDPGGDESKEPAAAGSFQEATPPQDPRDTAGPRTTPELPAVRHPVSLPALMTKRYDGGGLRIGRELDRTDAYTRYFVTYRSEGLRISGIINVPAGQGPFPALVLNHGYIEPASYTNGQGLAREQDFLARQGYVVLHTDYRNHAQSDHAPATERRLRLGYTVDVVNAVLALKKSRVPQIDGERIGLLGRSMGGGVTYNALVVRPGLVDAAVVYAPVSSSAGDNFNRWIRGERGALSEFILRRYGAPERNRAYWRTVSPITYFERITEPLLVHHGTVDDTCPIRWSKATAAELRRLGKDVRLRTYPGEGHVFYATWPASMRRTVAFFDRHLG